MLLACVLDVTQRCHQPTVCVDLATACALLKAFGPKHLCLIPLGVWGSWGDTGF